MKYYLLILSVLSFCFSYAQPAFGPATVSIKKGEDSLKKLSHNIIFAEKLEERFTADSLFTRGFVKALQQPNSFQYPFDSLRSIAIVYPKDSSFRIFSWQLVINENFVRQHGAIQMKTADGSLKLFPLIDKSDLIQNNRDTIADHKNWIGAVYYKIIQTAFKGKTYYTLLGFDDNNIRSDKKVIEVLTFENQLPIFGGNYFFIENSNEYTRGPKRIIMEFKKETTPRLTYDDELKMIVMEHLVSQTGEPNKKYTLVPDGDYEGWKWTTGRWVYITKIFNEVTPEGQAPAPLPIRNDDGSIDESKMKGGGQQ